MDRRSCGHASRSDDWKQCRNRGKWRNQNMKIEHIAMYVNDLEQTKNFFTYYFHAEAGEKYHNQTTGFQSYFLSFQGECRLEIMSKPEMEDIGKPLARTGYAHIALSVGTKEVVDSLTEQLRKDGYHIISNPRTTGDGYYESCIIDLEDNQIEITI